MTAILGISAFYHDSAAAVLIDGKIVAAAQEERFTRIKHDHSFPKNSIKFVLKQSKMTLNDIDKIIFYEKPFLKFQRLLTTYLSIAPKGFSSFLKSIPLWMNEKIFQKKLIIDELKQIDNQFNEKNKINFSEHHLSHAASAFYPSPFKNASVLTLDGVGEWTTSSISYGDGNSLQLQKEMKFPHSLGLLYSAFTNYLGFKVNSGEYKVMGLAPYGNPKYKKKILDNLLDLKNDGSFKLNTKFFDFPAGIRMINKNFTDLFGKKARISEEEKLNEFHMDIASSIQSVTEDIVLKIAKSLAKEHRTKNLCMAGGVALNCVANGKILKEKIFENIWIQPAAGDAGGAIGAALAYWYLHMDKPRTVQKCDDMQGSFLGPSFDNMEVEKELTSLGASFEKLSEINLLEKTASELASGKTVGWFQGRMEFGPRALGARSIIADPRSENMQKILNMKIKFRESFRPFAPAILEEDFKKYFKLEKASPYMLLVSEIQDSIKIEQENNLNHIKGFKKLDIKKSNIPAVTHVDFSARVQTVSIKNNKKFYNLLQMFKKITKCPVLVNTSFNIRGEPIVCDINDAYRCFMGTDLDILICEDFMLYKNKQKNILKNDYKKDFVLD